MPERALNLKWEMLLAAPVNSSRLGCLWRARKVFLNSSLSLSLICSSIFELYVAKVGFELLILLPPPTMRWDCRCVAPHPALNLAVKENTRINTLSIYLYTLVMSLSLLE